MEGGFRQSIKFLGLAFPLECSQASRISGGLDQLDEAMRMYHDIRGIGQQ